MILGPTATGLAACWVIRKFKLAAPSVMNQQQKPASADAADTDTYLVRQFFGAPSKPLNFSSGKNKSAALDKVLIFES